MKKIILTLFLTYSSIIFSQSFTGFKIGEKIFNENIYIVNDTIETKVLVLEDGYCYRIESKFTDLDNSIENVDYVKSLVETNNEWGYFNSLSDDYYDNEFNDDKPCLSCEFISCVIENDLKYLIYYSKKYDEYDEVKTGLILVEKKINMNKLPGIDKNVKNSPKTFIKFNSYNEFVNSQAFKDKKTTKANDIKIETIELPYKLKFGMDNTQINNHIKSLLDNNSTLSVKPINGDPTNTKLGITNSTFSIKTNGAFSFSVEVTFLNGKAFEYNYLHEHDMDKKLREKISALIKSYSIVNTTFGNNIYDTKTKEKVAELKENYKNRGNLENKM